MQVVNHIMPQRVLDGWMATTMRMRMSPNDARHVAWALGDFFCMLTIVTSRQCFRSYSLSDFTATAISTNFIFFYICFSIIFKFVTMTTMNNKKLNENFQHKGLGNVT